MLTRILEPEVMDTPNEAVAYDQLDHCEVNRNFVDDLLAVGSLTGEILDLGTGTARIPIEICRRSEDVRIMAVDLAVSMLDVARLNLAITPFESRIMLDRIDAKQLPYRDGTFDAVISNSLIHHIPDPFALLAEAVRVCRVGGRLFFRDLVRPSTPLDLQYLVSRYGGEDETGCKLLRDSLHAALSVAEIGQIVVELGFSAESVTVTSDRHWTWSTTKP